MMLTDYQAFAILALAACVGGLVYYTKNRDWPRHDGSRSGGQKPYDARVLAAIREAALPQIIALMEREAQMTEALGASYTAGYRDGFEDGRSEDGVRPDIDSTAMMGGMNNYLSSKILKPKETDDGR